MRSSSRQELDFLLCFSHLRWNFVYQRPQHLLSRAAGNHNVIFFEEPIFEAEARPKLKLTAEADRITIAVPVLPFGLKLSEIAGLQRRLLNGLLKPIPRHRTILWYYTPVALSFSRHLASDLCVYDSMDELAAFVGADPRVSTLEREMFHRADVVFMGGPSLYKAKRHQHDNAHCFPSSIDADHFRKARRMIRSTFDQAQMPGPKIGFFGVIDERMDLDLVEHVADLRPDWNLIMLGPIAKIDPLCLPHRRNIHWIGPRSYQELPAYLAGWDVGIMPFAINDSTRFISPTKTPEFLAAGLPVVSTPVTDVTHLYGRAGLVEIARGADEFVAKAEQLLVRPKTHWLQQVDAHLESMSWDLTWSEMYLLMKRAAHARRVLSGIVGAEEALRV